jgi:hypothetical protein
MKAVQSINEHYFENGGGSASINLSFETDGCNCIIRYGCHLIIDCEWYWAAEDEEDLRYGKTEYECLIEDITQELVSLSEAAAFIAASAEAISR